MFVFLLLYLNGWLPLLLWIIGMEGIEDEGLGEAQSRATEFLWDSSVAWGNWNCGYLDGRQVRRVVESDEKKGGRWME